MTEDVYSELEEHAAEIGTFRETMEGFVYCLEQYEDAKEGEAVFSVDEVEDDIAAHYAAFEKRKGKARDHMMDVFGLENRVNNARRQDTPYDDLPDDDDELEALLDEIEDVKETYYEARDVGEEARERVEEEFGGVDLLLDDEWYTDPDDTAAYTTGPGWHSDPVRRSRGGR